MFANNVEKLCHLDNSQGNESFNGMVASKAPKTRHYGSSESNDLGLPLQSPRKIQAISMFHKSCQTSSYPQVKLASVRLIVRMLSFIKKWSNGARRSGSGSAWN